MVDMKSDFGLWYNFDWGWEQLLVR
jgi:hypothetical protein